MPDGSQGYIISLYNPYGNNTDVIKIFTLHNIDFCIRAISQFDWGQPIFKDKPLDDDYTKYRIYYKLEDAEQFVSFLKMME